MRKSPVLVFILLCAICLQAEKVTEFPELMQPVRITIDGDEMFVVDGRSKIEVYSISDQKLLREISKSGQGPGEFQRQPSFFSCHFLDISREKNRTVPFYGWMVALMTPSR